jgi:putative tryptophan/tyrosine transport system substrate-binding protein
MSKYPKWAGLFAIVLALTLCGARAEAQQSTKVPHIGYLSLRSPSSAPARDQALREGLRELGYVEGKNTVIDWRYAEGNPDRLPALAAELVDLKVDLIISAGPANTRVLRKVTTTIPIVMTQDSDPVGNGFVVSLARPGGNITGLSTHYPEISGKQLELLKEAVPKLSRVAVLGNSTEPGNAQSVKETEVAAGAVKVQLQYQNILAPKDIETAFRSATKEAAGAVLVLASPVVITHRRQFVDLALKNRLPAMYHTVELAEDGGLMVYGVSFTELFRRAATYVDKILKGTKPADLPVEQPTKFEFVINLKTAKQIGLTIPPNVLARADKVIK